MLGRETIEKLRPARTGALLLAGFFIASTIPAAPPEDTPPRLVSRDVKPVYPEAARSAGVTGFVFFAARIGADGRVLDVEVLDVPEPDRNLGFERAVREAVLGWTFEPARRDGAAIEATYRGRVKYSLEAPEAAEYRGTRLYPLPSREVWEAASALVDELGFRHELYDDHGQLLATKHLTKKKKTRGVFESFDVWRLHPEGRATFVRLHVLVSPHLEPARVHVNAAVGLRVGRGRLLSTHAGVVEEWFLEQLDTRLGQTARRLPTDWAARTSLAQELAAGLGDAPQGCRSTWEHHDPVLEVTSELRSTVSSPELLATTRVAPLYPYTDRWQASDDEFVMQAVVLEDGSVQKVDVLISANGDAREDAAAAQAVRFWRYRPARREGCPVPVVFIIETNFLDD